MRPRKELSPTARETIRKEADRIAALGGEWQPSFESLAAMIVRVQEAEEQLMRERQSQGSERARAAGVKVGRPNIEKPGRFEEVRERWLARRLTSKEAAAILGVSTETFRKWCNELREEADPDLPASAAKPSSGVSARPHPNRSRQSDQRLMLDCLRKTLPTPRGSSAATLEEISAALGWSMAKAMQVRSDLLESEKLKVVTCRNKDMQLVPGCRITKLGWRFLEDD